MHEKFDDLRHDIRLPVDMTDEERLQHRDQEEEGERRVKEFLDSAARMPEEEKVDGPTWEVTKREQDERGGRPWVSGEEEL